MSAALDPFALGGWQADAEQKPPQSISELWEEHQRIYAEVERLIDIDPDQNRDQVSAMIDRELAIENEIAGAVATDKAGLIAQIRFLAYHHQDFEWGVYGDGIAENLIAGIAAMTAREGGQ